MDALTRLCTRQVHSNHPVPKSGGHILIISANDFQHEHPGNLFTFANHPANHSRDGSRCSCNSAHNSAPVTASGISGTSTIAGKRPSGHPRVMASDEANIGGVDAVHIPPASLGQVRQWEKLARMISITALDYTAKIGKN